jgi:hypothetical protein
MIIAGFVILLLSIGMNRWWARRSLRLLNVDQKALTLDALSQSNIWLPVFLAAWVIVTDRLPLGAISPHYRSGVVISYVIIPFLVALVSRAFALRRLSRLALPHLYIRSAWLRALIFYAALSFLVCVFFYESWSMILREAMRP